MDREHPQTNHYHPTFLKVGLFIAILASSLGVSNSILWIYRRVLNSLGLEIAEVIVAFLVIITLALILVGFRVGFNAKQILRQHKVQALRIYRLFQRCKFFRSLWEYIGPPVETENNSTPKKLDAIELPIQLDRPPRRGRPPTYSIDRWIRVVSAWENRDSLRNPLTLAEFLSQEFGTYADGSPRMSENSYYDWRKKVFDELRKQGARKKDNPD